MVIMSLVFFLIFRKHSIPWIIRLFPINYITMESEDLLWIGLGVICQTVSNLLHITMYRQEIRC